MNATTALSSRPSARRLSYGTLAGLLLVAVVLEMVRRATGYWEIAAFGLGPDIALFFGVGANLQKGQLHPRAVRLYNILHRYWLPLALALVASFGLLPLGYLIGSLAWGFHISLDRAVGYGLRTSDGLQRH